MTAKAKDKKAPGMRSIRYYIGSRMWEFILCIMTAFAAVGTELKGFYIDEAHQSNHLLIIGIAAIVILICFAGAYSRKSAVIAGLVSAFLILAGIIAVQVRPPVTTLFRDEEGNIWLFMLIIVVTSLVVFFLCRTLIGTGILFIAGTFLSGAVQFLYGTVSIYMMLMFICSAGAMYIYKNYQRNVLRTETVKTAFSGAFITSVALCAVITLIAAGIFFGVVKQLDPPQRELKLITNYKALEVLEKVGIADMQKIFDDDELTDQINDNEEESSNKGDETDNSDGDKEQQEDKSLQDERNEPDKLDDSNNPLLYPIKYAYSIYGPFVFLGLFILLIVLAVLLKLWLRRMWLSRVMKKSPEQRIPLMYEFYISRLRKIKMARKDSETPYEFCQREKSRLRMFRSEGADFDDITDIFVRTKYGRQPVSDEDMKRYLSFHKVFYRNCRKHLGNVKYIIKFFIL